MFFSGPPGGFMPGGFAASDTRKLTDCAYYLRGQCRNGDGCPFRHDPSKIGAVKAQHAQQDCVFYLQGMCKKGSLCPFRHDQSKLESTVAAAAAPARPLSRQLPVTVDFSDAADDGAAQASQPVVSAHQPMARAPVAAAPSVAPTAVVGRLAPSGRQPAAKPQDPLARPRLKQRQQQQQDQRGSGEETAGPAGLPARLAARLGVPGKHDEQEGGSSGPRPGKRRPGLAAAVFQEVLGHEVHAPGPTKAPAAQQQQLPQRKRRSSQEAGEEATPARVVEAVELAQPSAKRQACHAASSGAGSPRKPLARPLAAALAKPAAAPAAAQPASTGVSKAVPKAPAAGARAAAEAAKAEPIDFRPPKSIEEIRKERQQKLKQQRSPVAAPASAKPAAPAVPKQAAAAPVVAPTRVKPAPPAVPERAAALPAKQVPPVQEQQQHDQLAKEIEEFEEDYEALAGGDDDEDDFEAQMRALEEAL